jgi:hypothetical protein
MLKPNKPFIPLGIQASIERHIGTQMCKKLKMEVADIYFDYTSINNLEPSYKNLIKFQVKEKVLELIECYKNTLRVKGMNDQLSISKYLLVSKLARIFKETAEVIPKNNDQLKELLGEKNFNLLTEGSRFFRCPDGVLLCENIYAQALK